MPSYHQKPKHVSHSLGEGVGVGAVISVDVSVDRVMDEAIDRYFGVGEVLVLI